MKKHTMSELIIMADNAFNYLKKYFDKSVGSHNLVAVNGELKNNTLASFNIQGNDKSHVDMINIDETKLIKKLKNGKADDNLEHKLSIILDEIIGEQVGSILFYVTHKSDNGLGPVQEVIGYYGGIIYANRNNQEPLFLRPYRNEESYELARKLYTKFKDTKLAELATIKGLADFNNLISRLEVRENARTN